MISYWENKHIGYNIVSPIDHITPKFTNTLDDISKFDDDLSDSIVLSTDDKYSVVHTLFDFMHLHYIVDTTVQQWITSSQPTHHPFYNDG